MTKLAYSIKNLLPNLDSTQTPIIQAKKLTIPTKPVISVTGNPVSSKKNVREVNDDVDAICHLHHGEHAAHKCGSSIPWVS